MIALLRELGAFALCRCNDLIASMDGSNVIHDRDFEVQDVRSSLEAAARRCPAHRLLWAGVRVR